MAKRTNTKTTDTTKAVAYLRVSTADQHTGLEAQRAAIEAWATRTGTAVVAWYSEHVSGGAPVDKRGELLAAIECLEEHNAGVLVVAKRDRLARDTMLALVIEGLAKRVGARVVSAAGEGTDGEGPLNDMMRTLVDSFAQYERALIGLRTKAALAVKKQRGERTGECPFGFAVADDGKTLVENEGEQAVVRAIRILRAEGMSLRGIVAKLEAEGYVGRTGKPLALTQVARITS